MHKWHFIVYLGLSTTLANLLPVCTTKVLFMGTTDVVLVSKNTFNFLINLISEYFA